MESLRVQQLHPFDPIPSQPDHLMTQGIRVGFQFGYMRIRCNRLFLFVIR